MAKNKDPGQQAATYAEFAKLMGITRRDVAELVTMGALTRGAPVGIWLVEFGRFMFQYAKDWWKPAKQEEFAGRMDISQQAVAKLVAKNILTRGATMGTWALEYGKRMSQVAAGWQSQDGEIDRMKEAALLDRTKREEIKIRIDEKLGRLIPDDVFIDGVGETFSAVKSRLLSIPNRLRSRRPTLSAEDIGAVEDEVHDTLGELTDDRFPRDIRTRLEAEHSRVQAGAETNGQGGTHAKQRNGQN